MWFLTRLFCAYASFMEIYKLKHSIPIWMPMATELISHARLPPSFRPLENWSNFPIHRGFEMAGFSFARADPPGGPMCGS